MPDDLAKESEDFLRYCSELVRRIGHGGIADIPHLLTLYDQLRRALDAVSVQEIAWAEERAQGLLEKLMAMNAKLQAVRRLKEAVEQMDGAASGPASDGSRGRRNDDPSG